MLSGLPLLTNGNIDAENLSIRSKLILLSLISMTLIFIYAIKLSSDEYKTYEAANQSITIVETSVRLSNVLHELQKERGASAGFLSSGGKKFGAILRQQRSLTDGKLSELDQYLTQVQSDALKNWLSNIDFSGIPAMRNKVDQQSVDTQSAVAFYTAINNSILDTVAHFSTLPKALKIHNQLNSLILFISAKERAGIERAILSATFSKDKYTPYLHSKFLAVVAQQNVLFNLFEHTGDPLLIEKFKQMQNSDSFRQVQAMREIALAKTEQFNIDPTHWFKTITVKINQLKDMEDTITESVRVFAQHYKTRAITILVTVSLFSVLVLILTFLLSKSMCNSVRLPL